MTILGALHICEQCADAMRFSNGMLYCLNDDLNMIAMIGTSDWPCWLAEPCRLLLLLGNTVTVFRAWILKSLMLHK